MRHCVGMAELSWGSETNFWRQESHSGYAYATKVIGFNAVSLCCHSKIHSKRLNPRILPYVVFFIFVASPSIVSPLKAGTIHVYVLYCTTQHMMDAELR